LIFSETEAEHTKVIQDIL
jgi:hypothetical protein